MGQATVNGSGASTPSLPVAVFDGAVHGMAAVLLQSGVHPVDLVNVLSGHIVAFVSMVEQAHLRSQICEQVGSNLGRLVEARRADLVRMAGGVIKA